MSGQVEVPAGQVNLRGSLPCSENNVLQHVLHPDDGKGHAVLKANGSSKYLRALCLTTKGVIVMAHIDVSPQTIQPALMAITGSWLSRCPDV